MAKGASIQTLRKIIWQSVIPIPIPHRDDEPSAKDKAHESNGIGMTHDSQGSKTTEYIAPDPNLMPNANEPRSAGLRNQWSCHQDWT